MKTFQILARVAILAIMIALFFSSCSILHRTTNKEQSKTDSTAQTATQSIAIIHHDSTATTLQVDSAKKQSNWQWEAETTTVETMDTTGKLVGRTTVKKEKGTGHQEVATVSVISNHSQIRQDDTTANKAATNTHVKASKEAKQRDTTRGGLSGFLIIGVVIILLVLIWTHWDDLVLFIFRKRKKKTDVDTN